MMTLIRKFLPAVLLTALLSSSAWAQQTRLGTVDLRKIFDGYWKTQQADAALKDRAADMEKEYKNMISDWKKAKDDYETLLADANNQAISADERDKRKRTTDDKLKYLRDTEDSINQYKRQASATIDEQKRRMRDNILGEIRTVLNAKAKAAGFSMVFDVSAESLNGAPMVIYSDNSNDLTEAVLTQLNAGAPADAFKSAPKTNTTATATGTNGVPPGISPSWQLDK